MASFQQIVWKNVPDQVKAILGGIAGRVLLRDGDVEVADVGVRPC
jgi:hypothetical protein